LDAAVFKKFGSFYIDSFRGLSKYIWILGLVMLINRAGAMILPFMSLYMTDDLGYDYTAAGMVMGAYGVGSIIGSYIGGKLTDKFNYYDIQLFSLLFSGIIVLQLFWVTNYVGITIIVFLFSLVADMFRPANAVAVSAYAKKENITRSFSLMRLAINLGFTLGPAIGGIIAVMLGYKWIFVIDGVTCILASFTIFLLLPKKDAIERQEEKKGVEKGIPVKEDTPFLFFLVLTFLFALCFFQLFSSVPLFLRDSWGYDTDMIGLIMALNGFLIVIIEMPLIGIMEKKNKVFDYIKYGCILLMLSYFVLTLQVQGFFIIIIFTVIITFAEILAMPFMMNFVITRPSIPRQGEYMALYSVAYGIAHIISPVFGLWMADQFGFEMLYASIIFASFLAVIGFWKLKKMV
jgi:predicted MFS family arabinose efflux permease